MPTAMANQGTTTAAAGSNTSGSSNTASSGGGSGTPSTPVKVPSAAASYTPATLDPDLRSQINMVLIRDGHVTKIQDHVLHILNADKANWPAAVQAHALALLRSGDCTNFPALMRRVMDDIREDTLGGDGAAKKESKDSKDGTTNGVNGNAAAAAAGTPSLALPKGVMDEALKVTRESLEMFCEVEENGSL